jgi:hemerythrin-like metal-binding protein
MTPSLRCPASQLSLALPHKASIESIRNPSVAHMNWHDEYSVNIASINQQHQKMIDLINQLEDAATTHQELKVLGSVLSELLSHTKNHFKTEETLMTRYDYPGLALHRVEHETLVNRVVDFERKFEVGKLTDVHELVNFLMGWLEGHILGTDKKYGPYLVQKGVT